nr:nucleotidyltransferase family protein [Paenibacillus macquariensis]
MNTADKKDYWSVKNQARMHLRNHVEPYNSTNDAMSCWPETATAVGVYLDKLDHMRIIAPYGLDDLFQLKVRQSSRNEDTTYFMKRVADKEWLTRWPNLTLVEMMIHTK